MLMHSGFPTAIAPGIVTESWGILELLLGDAGAISIKRGVVFQSSPRQRVVAVTQTQKAAEAHDGIDHPA